MTAHAPKVWYREPWPWILMAGPFIVVIAGIITAWLAISSSDGLVTDDYYKKGLAAGQTIAQSDRAKSLGVSAAVRVSSEMLTIRLTAKDAGYVLPPALNVTVSHPTRAGLDQNKVLKLGAEGYSGQFRLPASGHWLVLIEDDSKSWRLMGNLVLPASGEMVIGGEGNATVVHNQ
jgi:hypothetical protein